MSRAGRSQRPPLTHVDERGHARMVDVGAKDVTARRAEAIARVTMRDETLARLRSGDTPKGDVLAAVRIAGIQGAKRTSELVPLCHPLSLTHVSVDVDLAKRRPAVATIRVVAETRDRTGVEMEALTGASVAALTLYDMLKAVDRSMSFTVELAAKSGGRSGDWRR